MAPFFYLFNCNGIQDVSGEARELCLWLTFLHHSPNFNATRVYVWMCILRTALHTTGGYLLSYRNCSAIKVSYEGKYCAIQTGLLKQF